MSGEIVRYRHRETGLSHVSDARRVMDAALLRLRSAGEYVAAPMAKHDRSEVELFAALHGRGEVVDVPRYCAVHDRGYVSRYIEDGRGCFSYAQSFRVTPANADQYRSTHNAPRVLPVGAGDDETCAWCGVTGFCAVLCWACGAEICFGRTTAQNYFYCRRSCGSEGQLHTEERPMQGVTPFLPARSGPYSSGQ